MIAKESIHSNKVQKRYWLFKSEPSTFSIDDLINSPNRTASWDGVRNFQARNYLRDAMSVGDNGFFYHSSCASPGIVGIVQITSTGTADVSAFDPLSPHYDPKSNPLNPRWFMVNVKFIKKLKTPITLQALKKNPHLSSFTLLQKGNRLSVMPVTKQQWEAILVMAK